jgi:hypothetical protein
VDVDIGLRISRGSHADAQRNDSRTTPHDDRVHLGSVRQLTYPLYSIRWTAGPSRFMHPIALVVFLLLAALAVMLAVLFF